MSASLERGKHTLWGSLLTLFLRLLTQKHVRFIKRTSLRELRSSLSTLATCGSTRMLPTQTTISLVITLSSQTGCIGTMAQTGLRPWTLGSPTGSLLLELKKQRGLMRTQSWRSRSLHWWLTPKEVWQLLMRHYLRPLVI